MRESIAHPAPALGVVLVEFTQYLNDLRVSNLSGRQRLFQPLVMRLLRKPRTRHATATGTRMRAPGAAISWTSGNTILGA